MVIANSDSNTTLVSLDNVAGGLNDKLVAGEHQKIVIDASSGLLRYVEPSASPALQFSDDDETSSSDGGVPTELLISNTDGSASEEHFPLYLPLNELDVSSREKHQLDIDRYISRNYYDIDNNEGLSSCLPGSEVLKESRDRLLASKRQRFSEGEQDRLLYVAQGERANATSDQYNVLMSDKATTCHILAFHSRTNSTRSKRDLPMTSLTHLDGPHYEQCVREMIQEHLDHHRCNNLHKESTRKRKFVEEEKKSDDFREPLEESTQRLTENVTIDIHVMGGFDDADSSSSSITEWLLRLLAQVAKEFKDQRLGVQMVMKTLVVSSSNNKLDDRNNDCPIGRGLAIDLHTGKVFLTDTQDDSSSSGPVSVLRSVRLWSRGGEPSEAHRLSVVHTSKDVDDLWTSIGYGQDHVIRNEYSLFWVQPFRFRSIPDVDLLLSLPNEILLQYTSTSPEVEEAGFCKDVRASMAFLKQHCETKNEDGSSYFGKAFDRPMVFAMRRSPLEAGKNQEEWKRLSF